MERQILEILKNNDLGKTSIAERLGKSGRTRYLNELVRRLTMSGLIEWTIPDKPNSRLQKYRITKKGLAYLSKAAR